MEKTNKTIKTIKAPDLKHAPKNLLRSVCLNVATVTRTFDNFKPYEI